MALRVAVLPALLCCVLAATAGCDPPTGPRRSPHCSLESPHCSAAETAAARLQQSEQQHPAVSQAPPSHGALPPPIRQRARRRQRRHPCPRRYRPSSRPRPCNSNRRSSPDTRRLSTSCVLPPSSTSNCLTRRRHSVGQYRRRQLRPYSRFWFKAPTRKVGRTPVFAPSRPRGHDCDEQRLRTFLPCDDQSPSPRRS